MFAYQESGRYFAPVARGLVEIAADELSELGAGQMEPETAGIHFQASTQALYRITYGSRLVSRVLAPLAAFACGSSDELYRAGRDLAWETIFTPERTFFIQAAASLSRVSNSHFAALRLKDAIVDRFRQLFGRRPDVDLENPDLRLHLHIERDQAVISLDVSGGALHRRGYRRQTVAATLKETLAAAIVRLSGWQGERPLIDPMCGSGTLLAEAALGYCRIPAAYNRVRFGFESLPDFDAGLWEKVRNEFDLRRRELPAGLIAGSDIDPQAVAAARGNLAGLPGGERVTIECLDFRDHPGVRDGLLLCNPPFGVRLGQGERLKELYGQLGDFLKQRCPGSTAYILCGNSQLIPYLGLKPLRRFVLFNGPIECRLLKIEIY